jgi:TonB family protein
MNLQIRRACIGFAAYFALLALVVPLPTSSQEPEALKPTKKVLPIYPDVLKHAGISGTVKVRVIIGPDGTVKDVEAHGGAAIFIDAVTKAVKQWRYIPTGEHQRTSEITATFECCNTVTTIP